MTPAELQAKLHELMALPAETEWIEFKEAKNTFSLEKGLRWRVRGTGCWAVPSFPGHEWPGYVATPDESGFISIPVLQEAPLMGRGDVARRVYRRGEERLAQLSLLTERSIHP